MSGERGDHECLNCTFTLTPWTRRLLMRIAEAKPPLRERNGTNRGLSATMRRLIVEEAERCALLSRGRPVDGQDFALLEGGPHDGMRVASSWLRGIAPGEIPDYIDAGHRGVSVPYRRTGRRDIGGLLIYEYEAASPAEEARHRGPMPAGWPGGEFMDLDPHDGGDGSTELGDAADRVDISGPVEAGSPSGVTAPHARSDPL